MIDQRISHSLRALPVVEGPVPVTADSYPFCAMAHSIRPLDVAQYGYLEEEYFVSGSANVYEPDGADRPRIAKEGLPYKTRLLVRRPADPTRFSGRVYFDILNATQNYDIEDLWHRIYRWCMANGHGYIGITSKPVNAQSLKNFDYARYAGLNWGSGETVPQPAPFAGGSIPGTEEGLIWDMLGQVGSWLRAQSGFFGSGPMTYLCLTGQSQSGAYLNTFIHYFDPILSGEGQPLFDGYLNIVGAAIERGLRQTGRGMYADLTSRAAFRSRIPFILISSEGDLTLFRGMGTGPLPEDRDEPGDRCRYYEVAGSPHTDLACPVRPAVAEIERAGRVFSPPSGEVLRTLNTFPLDCYVDGFLEQLYRWHTTGVAPACAPRIRRDAEGGLVRDEHGNAVGGFRTPYLDLPAGRYDGCDPNEQVSGTLIRFAPERLRALWGSKPQYLARFAAAIDAQIADGWLCPADRDRMLRAEADACPDF